MFVGSVQLREICMTEFDVSQLLTVEAAKGIIDAADLPRKVGARGAMESVGLRLAEEIRCDRDSPPFDKSLVDGFAVRSADLGAAGGELALRGKIVAGQEAQTPLDVGETMAIMTGAPLPMGADAVVPIENAEVFAWRVEFSTGSVPGRFVARRGSDAKEGDVALGKGTLIGAAQVGVLASVGREKVLVHEPPTAAVLGNGDELVETGATPAGAQIRASNNRMLVSLLAKWKCPATDLGIVRDDRKAIQEAIARGLESDLLLVSGGMSVGERDFVPGILKEMGAEMKITKLRIKPGKPFIFARMPGNKFVFGLPGNPVSAFVCTVTLVRRLIERWMGGNWDEGIRIAPAKGELEANGAREFYQPAIFDGERITPLAWRGSADVYTLARANALVIRPENDVARKSGEMVRFLEI
jgi:molybdopterin molybdotransferase